MKHHLISGLPEPQRTMAIERGYAMGYDTRLKAITKSVIIPDSEFYTDESIASREEITEWVSELRARGVDFFSRPCSCPECKSNWELTIYHDRIRHR